MNRLIKSNHDVIHALRIYFGWTGGMNGQKKG